MSCKEKYGLIILSHSSYKDIWELLFNSYAKIFNDVECGFDFFITCDGQLTDDENALLKKYNFQHITYDDSLAWSDALIFALEDVKVRPYDKVLFTFDDLILTHVNTDILNILMNTNCYKYLKLYNSSHSSLLKKSISYFKSDRIFEIDPVDSYRGNLVFSCWDRFYLNKVLRHESLKSISPWQFEERINHVIKGDTGFKCVFNHVFRYKNVIIKGKIHPRTLNSVEKTVGTYYKGSRLFLSSKERFGYDFKFILFKIGREIIPHRGFNFLRRIKQSIFL